MSACLEIAAGAFAVVGAADVIARTGREVYAFLCDVVDAPENIDRLSTTVHGITLLIETTQQCLKALGGLKQSAATLASLDAATRGLCREMQSLKLMITRFKGKNKTWSRIKYVLDDKKVSKALLNLERSKTMLGNALVVACKDLSSLNHEQTQDLIQKCHKQLGTETARLSRTMTASSDEVKHTISKESQETREILAQAVKDITTKIDALRMPIAEHKLPKSNRDIYFFGEQRDMIMAYLLLAKSQLRSTLGHLVTADEASSVAWLQNEFNHLVDSAAQEAAARYQGSAALAVDKWHYFDHDYNADPPSHEQAMEDRLVSNTTDKTRASILPDSPRRHQSHYRHISSKTSSGSMMVIIPKAPPKRQAQSPPRQESEDAAFTFSCNIGSDLKIIHSSFRREAFSPKICAQLSIFTLVPSEEPYNILFAQASIPEVDEALRNGTISPYHINREGRNMCLYYAAEHTRVDLFEYFDNQGIGASSLNHDISLMAGLFRRSMTNRDRPKLEASTDSVLNKVSDTPTFLYETTMNMLFWDYYQSRPRSILKYQLQRLAREGLLTAFQLRSIMGDSSLQQEPWDWPTIHNLIFALTSHGFQVDTIGSNGRNRIQRCLIVLQWEERPGNPEAIINTANALIKVGIDFHHRDHDGLTPSMYAKYYGQWEPWCTALEWNGITIEEVMKEDNTEWLLQDGWNRRIKELQGHA